MMKTKKLFGTFALFMAAFTLGATSFAEEVYLYVDTFGEVQTEVADNPTEAILEAENIDENSGVMEVTSQTELTTGTNVTLDEETYTVSSAYDPSSEVYAYVDVNGNIQTEVAGTPTEAIVEADARAYDSGVMVISE